MATVIPTPPASPPHTQTVYVEDAAVADFDLDPASPAPSDDCDSLSDEESTCSSDEGSLTSSCSSVDELDDDDLCRHQDIREAMTPPPLQEGPLAIFDAAAAVAAEEAGILSYPPQDYVQYSGPVPLPVVPLPVEPAAVLRQQQQQPMPVPVSVPVQQPSCAPSKYYFPAVWEWVGKYAQPAPMPIHHPHHHQPVHAFHHQVPLFALQGCY